MVETFAAILVGWLAGYFLTEVGFMVYLWWTDQ